MKAVLFSAILSVITFENLFANDWIPYVPQPQRQYTAEIIPPPVMTYANTVYPVYEYRWVPYHYNVPVNIIEYRFFCKRETTVLVPQTNWVLQPVYR